MARLIERIGSRRAVLGAIAALIAIGIGCQDNNLDELDPDIFVSPDEVPFGTVSMGMSVEEALTAQNTGGGTLTVDSVTMQDGALGFSVEAFSGELTPDSVTDLAITFAPVDTGAVEDVIPLMLKCRDVNLGRFV